MKKYKIIIQEILSTSVEVKAESVEDAKSKVEDMYYKQKIILTADDFAYREMREENEEDYKIF